MSTQIYEGTRYFHNTLKNKDNFLRDGAAEGNRTPTLSPETDFESVASTSSATAAYPVDGRHSSRCFRHWQVKHRVIWSLFYN